MILPDDKNLVERTVSAIPLDAPPTYEDSTAASSSSSAVAGPSTIRYPSDSKHQPPSPLSAFSSTSNSSPSPKAGWFGFASPTTRQVRRTVLGLVRDLVKVTDDADASSVVTSSILKSCSDACAANGLSISALLQEKIEGYTPLYWAIVKRPAENNDAAVCPPESSSSNEALDLLTVLLSLSAPLTPASVSDVCRACALKSDNALFQRLRASPDFSPLSPTDQMILDASAPPDSITVENVPHDEFAFGVDFTVVRFQTRMRVSKNVELDFIARGRMWRLAFHVVERRRPTLPAPGTWYISLSLLEHSPPTWIDSRLLVPAPVTSPLPTVTGGFGSGLFGSGKPRPRPMLSVRMKSIEQLHPSGQHGWRKEIIIVLDEGDGDGLGTLQYAGCPYIQPDESLHFRLEARLARPEAECVVC
ncbi:hypothetical protein C8F01DRAFT_1052716 [Mycena amicta]|nr:hypothetical protein C8F01DRAFT_1052716 [Mycena amicta]